MVKNVLPNEYLILDNYIDLNLSEFQSSCRNIQTLSVNILDSNKWFEDFCIRIEQAIESKKYLPVVRLCDGEYIFIIGKNIASKRLSFFKKLKINSKEFLKQLINYKLVAGGENRYKSGTYTANERKVFLQTYLDNIRDISKSGIMALHLSWGNVPFTEGLWPKLKKHFDQNNIFIDSNNYVPFYFVYALLAGSKSKLIFENKNILVINGAKDEKRESIINQLYKRGVKKVIWKTISTDRSLFDKLDFDIVDLNVDLVLVGAGIGKLNILKQLSVLNVPCIDIGFYFEILANEKLKFERTMCYTDNDLKSLNI